MNSSPKSQPQIATPPVDTEDSDDRIIGTALLWSLPVVLLLCLAGGLFVYFANRPKPTEVTEKTELPQPKPQLFSATEPPNVPFTDITEEAGITFKRTSGARGEKLLPETMGSGCAFFDYNNDGFPDLLFVNSAEWPWTKDQPASAPTVTLYQNDGKGHFRDVTVEAGLAVSFYGMGVSCADYDGDGWVDLFITGVGGNHLFHNNHGKFEEVTQAAGVGGRSDQWSTAAAWFDADGDGRLDLYVGNYVQWSREIDIKQGFTLVGNNQRAYGPPTSFEGTFPYFYHNNGDGTFTEMAAAAGFHVKNPNTGVPVAKTMAVLPIDLDGDGRIDLVVANDTVQNFVFHNEGGGKFTEIGASAGIAFDSSGNVRGAMGIDGARFRNDQCLGVAIGNFSHQMMALYAAMDNSNQFVDSANATGLGPQTRTELTFGVMFFDADLDGRLDLFAANGHLEEDIGRVDPTQTYAQAPALFWNAGSGQPTEFMKLKTAQLGADFMKPLVGRGCAFADIDGDGDLDVVITQPNGTPRLLRNDQKLGHSWLRVKLENTGPNRDAIGAWIEVTAGKLVQRRQVMPTRGYLSQSELPVTFGFGKSEGPVTVRTIWPDGTEQTATDVKTNQSLVVRRSQAASPATK